MPRAVGDLNGVERQQRPRSSRRSEMYNRPFLGNQILTMRLQISLV